MTLGSGNTSCWYNVAKQPNGTEVYRWVSANDTAGNWNRTADLNVTINLSGPVPLSINVDNPLNQSYNTTSLDLNITVSKSADYCWYNLNSTTNQSMSGSGTDWDAERMNDTIWFTVDLRYPLISNIQNGTVTFSYAYILWNTDEPSTSIVYYSTNQSDLSSSETNSTLVTTHNITLSNLTGSSTYYYNVSSCDSAGNCNKSSTYNFTTPTCVESWSCGEWSECSGSIQSRDCTDANSCGTTTNKPDEARECEEENGGGGGGTYTPSVPQPYVSHSWEKITPENVSIMKLNEREIGIHEIGISVISEANGVSIKVTKLDGKPASVVHNVSGEVYQYIDIYSRNLDTENIEKAIIRFNVNKTWIRENNISRDSVVLNRYSTFWNELPTIRITENSEVVFYEAESPGFSVFVISGEVLEFQPAICGNYICESGEDSNNCPNDCPIEQPQACSPSERRCLGSYLQQCSSDGTIWETLENCQYGCSEEKCLEKPAEFFDFINNIDYTLLALVALLIISIPLGGILLRRKKKSKKKEEPSRTEAYCIKCKKKVKMKNEQIVTMKNGKMAKKGTCPNCGTRIFRLGIGKHAKPKEQKEKDIKKTEVYCLKCKKKVFMKDEQVVTMNNGRKAKKGTCPDCGKTVFRMGIK
jgi:PGF-pre-PGF domain-containing protein